MTPAGGFKAKVGNIEVFSNRYKAVELILEMERIISCMGNAAQYMQELGLSSPAIDEFVLISKQLQKRS